MLYILYGENSYSIHHFLAQLKVDSGIQDSDVIFFTGAQLSPAQLGNAVNTIPFLVACRFVVVEGLLARFEPKKNAADTTPKELVQTFYSSVHPLPPTTTLVLVEEKPSPQNPLFKLLTPVAELKHFPLLKRDELLKWIDMRVAERGGKIIPSAMNMLANLAGNNLWGLSNEIDKLLQYSAGKPIQDTHIQEIVVLAKETNVFHLVDALLQHRSAVASRLLHQLIMEGVTPTQLIGLIAWRLRNLVIAKDLLVQKVPEKDIQHKLGLQDFAVRPLIAQARALTFPKLKYAYKFLLDTDLAIKTGRQNDEVALDVLVAELGKNI